MQNPLMGRLLSRLARIRLHNNYPVIAVAAIVATGSAWATFQDRSQAVESARTDLACFQCFLNFQEEAPSGEDPVHQVFILAPDAEAALKACRDRVRAEIGARDYDRAPAPAQFTMKVPAGGACPKRTYESWPTVASYLEAQRQQ